MKDETQETEEQIQLTANVHISIKKHTEEPVEKTNQSNGLKNLKKLGNVTMKQQNNKTTNTFKK